MLFRRRTHDSFILIVLAVLSFSPMIYGNDTLDRYKKRGEEQGKKEPHLELTKNEIDRITPNVLKGQIFDGEQARIQLTGSVYQDLEKAPSAIDPSFTAVIENTQKLLDNQKEIESSELTSRETIEKCLFEKELVPMTLTHNLSVRVIPKLKMISKIKICRGHEEKEKSRNPSHDKRKQKRKLKEDSNIKSFEVWIDDNGFGHRDEVVSHYKHIDNAVCCNNYYEVEQEVDSGKWDEEDIWVMDQENLLDSIDCTLVSISNGPSETRFIDGYEIFRPYWKKTHSIQCIRNKQINCDFLKNKSCIQTSEKCIKNFGGQCIVWEKTFKCSTRIFQGVILDNSNLYGTDTNLWQIDYQPNVSFSDVATKLAVFDEMKKELEDSQVVDIRKVSLFKGSKQRCSKSILEDVMYDCCSDMDGFATKIKLSKCTADEIALAESRKKGLTHFIGKKKEKFMGLWESRTEYVFCVFPTKLSRIFQEESRKQLDIEWGSAEHPDCRGLTQEEIKKLDFSKLNLLEAFEIPPQVDQTEKIKKIEERLKNRIENL